MEGPSSTRRIRRWLRVRDAPAARLLKVLIVDDEPDVRALVRSALTYARQDMTAVEAADGDEALAMIHSERPDLVVLDLALPKRDGFAVLEQVREKTDLPIIVLTARGLEEDKVKGLRLGADDYLTKPFSPRELVARIESVLRRSAPRPPRSGTIETHDLAIDMTARRVRRAGKDIHFTPTEFNLLAGAREPSRRSPDPRCAPHARVGTRVPVRNAVPEGLRRAAARQDRGRTERAHARFRPSAGSATDSRAWTSELTAAHFSQSEIAEEEVLTLSERPDVPIRDREHEERARPDVRDLLPVRRPCGHHVVGGLANDPDARAVARSEVQVRRDVEMRRAARLARATGAGGHARHACRPPRTRSRSRSARSAEPGGTTTCPSS